MRSPGSDAQLVKGLLFTDGVIDAQGLHYFCEIEISQTEEGVAVADAVIPPVYVCDQFMGRRASVSSTSCGLCGRESLDELAQLELVRKPQCPFDPSTLNEMHRQIEGVQETFSQTGGSHAAAMFDAQGKSLVIQEDVGRHNAVDKIVGFLVEKEMLTDAEVLWVSGRVSFEIVLKACRVGVPILAAVSAPTSLAVEIAEKVGISLLGFCRDDRCTVYSACDQVLV